MPKPLDIGASHASPLGACDQLRPALLDPANLEDGEGGSPGDDEGGNDDETEDAEVQAGDEAEDAAPQLEDADQDLRELDHADEEGDEDRERGHRQVVEDLPDRV